MRERVSERVSESERDRVREIREGEGGGATTSDCKKINSRSRTTKKITKRTTHNKQRATRNERLPRISKQQESYSIEINTLVLKVRFWGK